MNKILDNGIRFVFEETKSDITSICIGFEAGAAADGDYMGIAHATEHMLYKGTVNRDEDEINLELSNIFAFQNAMTNYPYVIYYGSTLKEDMIKGLELFADILMNPTFPIKGFDEEVDVIIQELNEWDEDLEQYCEDKLLFNSIEGRLKYPIIGVEEKIKSISLDDIKEFYNKYYCPKNMVITIVSSIKYEEVLKEVENIFGQWNKEFDNEIIEEKNLLRHGTYNDYREGNNSARIEIIYDIQFLNNYELGLLNIFNEYFCQGINSKLFYELRTKRGLVYDVLSTISYEKHIGLYKISCTTFKDKVEEVIKVYRDVVNNSHEIPNIMDLIKRIKLRKLFKEEQGIVLAKTKTINEIMQKHIGVIEKASIEEVLEVVNKVIINEAIEVVS